MQQVTASVRLKYLLENFDPVSSFLFYIFCSINLQTWIQKVTEPSRSAWPLTPAALAQAGDKPKINMKITNLGFRLISGVSSAANSGGVHYANPSLEIDLGQCGGPLGVVLACWILQVVAIFLGSKMSLSELHSQHFKTRASVELCGECQDH